MTDSQLVKKDSACNVKIGLLTFLLNAAHSFLRILIGCELAQKFLTIYAVRRFITAFTNSRHLSLSWASSIHSMSSLPTSWRYILILSSHLRLGLPSGLFLSGFPTKTLYSPYTCYMPHPHRLDENPFILVPSCTHYVQWIEKFAMGLSERKHLCQEPFINGLFWRILSSNWKLHWQKKWWIVKESTAGKVVRIILDFRDWE